MNNKMECLQNSDSKAGVSTSISNEDLTRNPNNVCASYIDEFGFLTKTLSSTLGDNIFSSSTERIYT